MSQFFKKNEQISVTWTEEGGRKGIVLKLREILSTPVTKNTLGFVLTEDRIHEIVSKSTGMDKVTDIKIDVIQGT
jgi:hypothetical protein